MNDGDRLPWEEPLGAVPHGGGTTTFRVWAPGASEVQVEVGGRREALDEELGVWSGRVGAGPGDRYRYLVNVPTCSS